MFSVTQKSLRDFLAFGRHPKGVFISHTTTDAYQKGKIKDFFTQRTCLVIIFRPYTSAVNRNQRFSPLGMLLTEPHIFKPSI